MAEALELLSIPERSLVLAALQKVLRNQQAVENWRLPSPTNRPALVDHQSGLPHHGRDEPVSNLRELASLWIHQSGHSLHCWQSPSSPRFQNQ